MLFAALRKYVPAAKRAAVSSCNLQLISRYEGTRSRYPVTQSCPSLAPSPENLTSKRLLAFRGLALPRCISADADCGQATDTVRRRTVSPHARSVAPSAFPRIQAPLAGFPPALSTTA